jgi:hypothetical protein
VGPAVADEQAGAQADVRARQFEVAATLAGHSHITKMDKLVVLRVFGTDDIVPGYVAVWLPES